MKTARRSELGRLAKLVGEREAKAFARMLEISESLDATRSPDEPRGVCDYDLVRLDGAKELTGVFRPGLIAIAGDGAGDYLAWDLRRGAPKRGAPVVLHCDHEIGLATPFAVDVSHALLRLCMLHLVGTPGRAAAAALERWRVAFAELLPSGADAELSRLAERAKKKGNAPLLPSWRDGERLTKPLTPPARGGYCTLPPTHLPLLDPNDRRELREKSSAYDESIAEYREMVHVEKRSGYAWYLAAALRAKAEVDLRRGKLADAARSAAEALRHYEPLLEAGETRVRTQLAFVQRVLMLAEKRRRPARALAHAEQALDAYEAALMDFSVAAEAGRNVAHAWERELAGEDPYEVYLTLNVAHRSTRQYLEHEPPHAFQEHAQRFARLAAAKKVDSDGE